MAKLRKILLLVFIIAGVAMGLALEEGASEPDLPILVKKQTPLKAPRPKYVPDEIIVKFKPGAKKDEIETFNLQQEAKERYESPYAHFKVLKIPKTKTVEEMVEIYKKNPNIEYAEPNYYAYASMVPNDSDYQYQWHLDDTTYAPIPPGFGGIHMEQAWDVSTGDPSVIVAVIDTGVAYENYPAPNHWHIDSYNAYGGSGNSWWCGANIASWVNEPGYGNGWKDYLQHTFPELVTATGTVTLTYQYRHDLEVSGAPPVAYDFAYTEISTNDGTSWTTLKTYTGKSLVSGSVGWKEETIDLTSYKGQNILLRFRFNSDDYWSDEDGGYPSDGAIFIDEIRITDGAVPIFYDNVESGAGTWQTTQYEQAPDLASTNFWVNSDEQIGDANGDGYPGIAGKDDDGDGFIDEDSAGRQPGETGYTNDLKDDDDENGYIDDRNGWDFVNSDAHPNDDNSHGTHVTGTIAQTTNNTLGVAGIAFNTTIMPIKVLDAAGGGTNDQVADGIYYAANNGAKVINLSLGGGDPDITLEDAVEYAYYEGVTLIAAAGNGWPSGNPYVDYPAAYDCCVIAVGATRYDQTRAYYSNYGPVLDPPNPSLDLVAPGGDTSIDQNADGKLDGVLQNTFGDTPVDWVYALYQGTSMATPHVSGVAALLLACDSALTPDDIRSRLQSTAIDLGNWGLDDEYGYGLVDAFAALWPYYSLGVSASPNNWGIGDVGFSSVTTMTSANRIMIQNQGNVQENFSLRITNTGGTWSVATTENGNTANTFVMSGLFSSLSDSIGAEDFNEGTDDDVLVSSALKKATSTIFGCLDCTQNGTGVAPSTGRYLWLQFKAPTSSTVSGQQSITVTVGTEQAP